MSEVKDRLLRVVDRGDRFAEVREEMWVSDAGDAWLVSTLPRSLAERREVGVFRAELPAPLIDRARRLAASGADRILGEVDDELALWYAEVRAAARVRPWSTLALDATTSAAPDGITVRFTFSAGGERPTRILCDRSTFVLVGDTDEVRHRFPEPDSLWSTAGTPLANLLVDFVIEPGQPGTVAFFAVPSEALPARASVQVSVAAITDEQAEEFPYPEALASLLSETISAPG